jgi:hypothetical protein
MATDFTVQNEGNVFILYANSDAAKQWVVDHLPAEAATWGSSGVVIEHRYVGDIVAGIQGDGLTVE